MICLVLIIDDGIKKKNLAKLRFDAARHESGLIGGLLDGTRQIRPPWRCLDI